MYLFFWKFFEKAIYEIRPFRAKTHKLYFPSKIFFNCFFFSTNQKIFINIHFQALKKEFTELKSCTAENLMFVKEDLIIPHFYTFQDFIVTKAMGKTGPLFVFDSASDVRIRQDAALDYGESHPAKIVLRSWYEKNKHIYPASRWEPFVPSKKYGRNFDDLSDL